ncbi:MAG: chloride channel protein [Coriobacteriia bacterium]|nr:chloride channel protein [Coriobacteriia bacterium]
MTDLGIDSKTATKEATTIFLVAILIGAICGLATFLFVAADHLGVSFLWDELPHLVPGVPSWAVGLAVVAVFTILATAVVAICGKRPFDVGGADAEYNKDGRMEYRQLLAGAAFSLLSLFSGAAVGPEAPLTDINGGLGTFVAERIGLKPDQVKVLTYAGVAGAFSAFFGAAPIGALLAAELISPMSETLNRTVIVSGLASGATGWVVYESLGGQKIPLLLQFSNVTSPSLWQLGVAVLLGLLGAVLGLAYGAAFMKSRLALQPLRKRPWLAALAGGTLIAVASVVSPFLLFSGQGQVAQAISQATALGALVLIALGVGKLVLSIGSLSTAYFGGPIFPLIFSGVCFGLAVSLIIPGIPQGLAVMAVLAGMVSAATVAPLSITIFLALMTNPELISVIAIAAVAAFIVRQAVAPTLPGVYRATRAAEHRAARKS